MIDFLKDVSAVAVPAFVLSTMLNVGLTQKPSRILHHLQNWHFLIRMLLINLVVVPALMIAAVVLVELEPIYAAGLVVFAMSAGAPFLVRLTMTLRHEIALGATVMVVLMVGTVVIMPAALPFALEGIDVDAGGIVKSLLSQMIAPMVVGMLFNQFLEAQVAYLQPWVARFSSVSLYVLIASTLVGYAPDLADRGLWKAAVTGFVVLALAFFLGFMMGDGRDQLNDVGGLGTAQRGTASAMIVATSNFTDPRVLVIITLVNTLGLVFLIGAAKTLSKDNQVTLDPPGADEPQRPARAVTAKESAP